MPGRGALNEIRRVRLPSEVGKRADLFVLSGNPLEKISNIRTARLVAAGGALYDCARLWAAAGYK
jgi:hypothetical protein